MRVMVLVALLGVAACVGGEGERRRDVEGELDMALSCQLRACVCRAETATLFFGAKTSPVRWRQNGDAHCDKGFELAFDE